MKNQICQKVGPVLKFLNKNLSDGTLKPGKIKLEVFLNLKSKKGVKSEKWFCTLPPPHFIHPHPLIIPPAPPPPGKKIIFAPCPLIMHPRPLAITVSFPYVLKSPFLHSVENWIKCDNIIHLQQGAGGIIRGWGLRGQGAKIFFLPGGGGAGGIIRGWW